MRAGLRPLVSKQGVGKPEEEDADDLYPGAFPAAGARSLRTISSYHPVSSRFHDIDLIVINGNETELCNVDGLRGFCRNITVLPDPEAILTICFRRVAPTRISVAMDPPLSVVAHNGSMVTRGIVEATKGEHYDAVVWAGADLLPNLIDALPSISAGKVFVDFIDSPSLWGNTEGGSNFPHRASGPVRTLEDAPMGTEGYHAS